MLGDYHLPFGEAEAQAKAARWLWSELHHLIEKGDRAPQIGARFLSSNRTRGANMPLLFYLPLIIWMGLFEAAQDEMRVPVKVNALRKTRR